jgi:hypothetical protein
MRHKLAWCRASCLSVFLETYSCCKKTRTKASARLEQFLSACPTFGHGLMQSNEPFFATFLRHLFIKVESCARRTRFDSSFCWLGTVGCGLAVSLLLLRSVIDILAGDQLAHERRELLREGKEYHREQDVENQVRPREVAGHVTRLAGIGVQLLPSNTSPC